MPSYRVLYLKEKPAIDRFRNLPPADGSTNIKPKDYIPACEIDAPSEYAAWRALQGQGAKERNLRPLGVGDVLEAVTAEGPGKPRVCRYSGFDEAVWFVFEPREKKGAASPESLTTDATATSAIVTEAARRSRPVRSAAIPESAPALA